LLNALSFVFERRMQVGLSWERSTSRLRTTVFMYHLAYAVQK